MSAYKLRISPWCVPKRKFRVLKERKLAGN
jgi:hypothetical protein